MSKTMTMNELDVRVAELAARYRTLAAEILREAIRIPADHVDRPADAGGDASCGLSNHEKPRLDYLRRKIAEVGAVRRPEDVSFDGYGNLVWTVDDPDEMNLLVDRGVDGLMTDRTDILRAVLTESGRWRTRP